MLRHGNTVLGILKLRELTDFVTKNRDYVFESNYHLESIEEHTKFMLEEKHLKAVPRYKKDKNGQEIVEYGSYIRGILEELEKAHMYIAKLNELIKEQQKAISILSGK